MACLFVGVSCVILLFGVGSTLSDWGSIETREAVAKALSGGALSGVDLEVSEVLVWLRWVLMAAAAIASAGIIFAIYTAKGHQPSRIILTVLCGFASLLFLAGGLWGLLPAAFSIGCGFYLWSAESRRWFAVKNGKEIAESPRGAYADRTAVSGGGTDGSGTDASGDPFASHHGGRGHGNAPEANGAPVAYPAAAAERADVALSDRRRERPKSVLYACWATIGLSALVAFVCGVNAVAYLVSPDSYASLIEDQPLLRDSGVLEQLGTDVAGFAQLIGTVCAVATVLAVFGIASAIYALTGKPAGRMALLVISWITLAASVLAFPVGLPWTAAAIAVVVVLLRAENKSWFHA